MIRPVFLSVLPVLLVVGAAYPSTARERGEFVVRSSFQARSYHLS